MEKLAEDLYMFYDQVDEKRLETLEEIREKLSRGDVDGYLEDLLSFRNGFEGRLSPGELIQIYANVNALNQIVGMEKERDGLPYALPIAVESTKDYADTFFSPNMNNTNLFGREDYYRIVFLNDYGYIQPLTDEIFYSKAEAELQISQMKGMKLCSYDYLVNHALSYTKGKVNLRDQYNFDMNAYREEMKKYGWNYTLAYGQHTYWWKEEPDNSVTKKEFDNFNSLEKYLDGKKEEELPRRFFDLDGTLAVFKPVEKIEALYEKGYFENLEPIDSMVEAVNLLLEDNQEEVFIMSSVLSDSPYALKEKNAWIDKHLPGIDEAHRIFPPCGANKLDYIPEGVRPTDCLIDDYTHNLVSWEPPAIGIKVLNGINHTNQSWEGNRISITNTGADIARKIKESAEGVIVRDIRPQDKQAIPDIEKDIRTLKELSQKVLETFNGMTEALLKGNPDLSIPQQVAEAVKNNAEKELREENEKEKHQEEKQRQEESKEQKSGKTEELKVVRAIAAVTPSIKGPKM